MSTAQIADRAVVLVTGPDAESLLQNVVTPDLSCLGKGEAMPGALLTPQGKILFDFLISRADGSFRLDCRSEVAADFLKRLMLYRLRAKVEISLEEQQFVHVSWETDSSPAPNDSKAVADCRFPARLGVVRHYGEALHANTAEEAWHRLRIAHGVAESGSDYLLGEAFPHDILFDQNGGVALKKGCFVGQEVVSRMHHRGTARRRLVIVHGAAPLPVSGTGLTAGGRTLGALGTVCGSNGLAIVRIDRAAEAHAAGKPVTAGDVMVRLAAPAYAAFTLDGKGSQAGDDLMAKRHVKPPRAWQRMLSGRRLDLLDPSPLDVEITDIAHGLARVARWNGQTEGDHAFSVAQHSLLVEEIFRRLNDDAEPGWAMAALLHDAPEYVIGDMISPFKATLGDDYKSVEKRLQHAIHLRFALPPEMPTKLLNAIKRADRIAAFFEATRLAGFSDGEAARFFGRPRGFSADALAVSPQPARRAQKAFLARFHMIEKLRARSA